MLVFVGAGCSTAPVADVDGVPEPTISTDGPLETNVSVAETEVEEVSVDYVMSSGAVAFTAPAGATATQSDAGGVSAIYLKKGDTSLATIATYLTTNFEGEAITFTEWKDVNIPDSEQKNVHALDGVTFEEHYIAAENEPHTYYIGSITGEKDLHVSITIPERERGVTEDLLASMIFYGNDTELEGYEVIR